jgi:hypothetical protein
MKSNILWTLAGERPNAIGFSNSSSTGRDMARRTDHGLRPTSLTKTILPSKHFTPGIPPSLVPKQHQVPAARRNQPLREQRPLHRQEPQGLPW